MKRWISAVVALAVLACLVPLSSKHPDAVQHVLGLSGGADQALKAAGGILVASATVMGLMFVLRKMGGKK